MDFGLMMLVTTLVVIFLVNQSSQCTFEDGSNRRHVTTFIVYVHNETSSGLMLGSESIIIFLVVDRSMTVDCERCPRTRSRTDLKFGRVVTYVFIDEQNRNIHVVAVLLTTLVVTLGQDD